MANAMLQEDFKSSHPDLANMNIETTAEADQERSATIDSRTTSTTTIGNLKTSSGQLLSLLKPPGSPGGARKSVDFAILPPPKRSRSLGVRLTAKQVVDGAFAFPCCMSWLARASLSNVTSNPPSILPVPLNLLSLNQPHSRRYKHLATRTLGRHSKSQG